MKQEVIKQIVKVGNGAGVILPKSWLNGKAKVELFEKPLNLREDIIGLLGDCLEDVAGIYLVGSYAREEQTKDSDVDVLVITNNTNKKIENGKYNLILISKKELENQLNKNALPLLPMLKESKSLLNLELVKEYKKRSLLDKEIKYRLSLIESSLKINKELIDISENVVGDGVAYSLILNLRTLYLINCLKKNKKWSNKDFKNLIKKIAGSLESYKGYLRSKKGEKSLDVLDVGEAKKLNYYVEKKLGFERG